ncbi:MAG TPA: YciI family protein [Thermomicrobiales bacterium]|jgi:hypothetical protein
MTRFALLIRGGDEELRNYTPEQMQQTLQQYFVWSDKLRSEGHFLGGEQLAGGGRTVRTRNGQTAVDGPYAETKESIGGYFIIAAASEDEAAAVAEGCPVLGHGGLVEVREIVEN